MYLNIGIHPTAVLMKMCWYFFVFWDWGGDNKVRVVALYVPTQDPAYFWESFRMIDKFYKVAIGTK